MQSSSLIDLSVYEISVTVASDKTATVEVKTAGEPSIFTPTLQAVLSKLDSKSTLNILIGIAAAMRRLHENGYAHMQLNSQNILIRSDTSYSLINLSDSHKIASQSASDAKYDVYSFALLMNEMFNKASTTISNTANVPAVFLHLFKSCADTRAEQRPTFAQILDELQNLESASKFTESSVYRPNLRLTTDFSKFEGVIPAFYACYNDNGEIDKSRTKALTRYLINAGVKGLYVGGSSGECIYQSVEERKKVLEAVQEENNHEVTIIAHVACNNLFESQELARHAESLEVDAIAAIPPIYFKLPDYSIADYWNGISQAAPHTPFVIYNIPQLAGVSLTRSLLTEMLKNPNVIGVKNSSESTQDIQMWKDTGDGRLIVFNGPDEQLVSGLMIGAEGCIGGTYGVYPELVIKCFNLVKSGDNETAREMQNDICRIIYKMVEASGNLYAVIKEVLRQRTNGSVNCGEVRAPLSNISEKDQPIIAQVKSMIDEAYTKYLS
ncbi:hypothetical protein TRFO_01729 [Tritrichomonas foetus]|uniref:N-acetylneuraminate lyase n=1 Tax=Tritrichomonas foetus TaxID=1144522 RepID=A0A1J4JUD7_9EUKA|nr:hypothetical protein TRFO_01729 [Tritrichomonas foetus]|eukprot:OHT01132.1 hypothetical protein TRFO_01729 [Tritrichomonas foetus]